MGLLSTILSLQNLQEETAEMKESLSNRGSPLVRSEYNLVPIPTEIWGQGLHSTLTVQPLRSILALAVMSVDVS